MSIEKPTTKLAMTQSTKPKENFEVGYSKKTNNPD
jgi:hypothetical protein